MPNQQKPISRIEHARKAFRHRDLHEARKAHDRGDMEAALHTRASGAYIGDLVYGAIDGIITTFAVVSGVAGARLSAAIVLILGFANLLADGLSMAVGNYLATRSERDYQREERARETWEVEHLPEQERAEIREIYERKGFAGNDLERAVDVITSDKKRWVDEMMFEELGIIEDESRPIGHAAATFIAFVVAGFVPLLAYVLGHSSSFFRANAFGIACVLTALTLFAVGVARTLVTRRTWLRSGTEMLLLGGLAAAAAYAIGHLLRGLVD